MRSKLIKIIFLGICSLVALLSVNAQTLKDGLVAYYPFSGDAGDESGNGNDATLNNASLTADRFGKGNSALLITGNDGGATSANNIRISGNVDRTISFWCKSSKPTGSVNLGVGWGNSSRRGGRFYFSETGDRRMWFWGHYADIDYPVSGVPYDQWRHLVFVYKSSLNDAVCYVDGIVVPRSRFGVLNETSTLNTIETTLRTFGGEGDFIDDVRIYNRALSGDEVTELYDLEEPEEVDRSQSTFQIVEGNFTWEQAKADAEAKGGRLAVLNSQEKIDQANDFIATFDREIQPWIGLTDREEEGVWKWINGESYTIDRSHWLPWEPDNSPDSDGVYITDKFKFGDHPSDLNAYLIELEIDWSQSTFSLVQGTFGWKEAKLDAESRGGRLAVVNTPEKNEIAANLAKSLFLDTDGNRGWIGLTDEEVEGQWKWIDGTPLQWSNWYPGNPSTIANENYATYWVGSSWADNADANIPGFEHHKWSYILEMPAADSNNQINIDNGLVAYYPFNGNADDESGNGNNGTVEGATLTTDRKGNAGSAFNFNGTSIIRISDSDSLDLEEAEPATFSVWVNVAVQNRGHIFGKRRGDTTNYMLDLNVSGRPYFRGSPFDTGILGDAPLATNQWIHLACTWDGATCRLFIDGQLSKEGNESPTGGTDDHDFVIGGTGAGHTKFKGKIDELRIYNRALSEREVAELYEPEKPLDPDPSPPVLTLEEFYEALPDETITIDATPESGFPDDFTYQWYFGTFLIPELLGGKESSRTLSANEDNNGLWKVVVSNSEGFAESIFNFMAYKDTDGDGISDGRERFVIGSDPELADTDSDGIKDYDEVYTYGTSFSKADTDGDGFDDIFEINTKYDPLNQESTPEAYLEIQTAVEIKFNAAKDLNYKIENSVDLENWSAIENGVLGKGGLIKRIYSIDDYPGRYFRVKRE